MKCRYCSGTTRVVATEHRADGTHRWLRCLKCDGSTRTIERYVNPKPGPQPGSKKTGVLPQGERNGNAVLTEADVRRLRHKAASGVMQKVLAKEFGLAPATVSRIVTRRTWTHVQ